MNLFFDVWLRPAPPAFRYAVGVALCATVAVAAMPLVGVLDLANIVMLFLLVVALVATFVGRGPAVVAAVTSVGLFDFLFVEPRFSLAVADAQYVVTFAVMLVVALIIGELAARLRREADVAARRERRARALYGLARELAGVAAIDGVAQALERFLGDHLAASGVLAVPGADGVLEPVASPGASVPVDLAVALRVFESGEPLEYVDLGNAAAPSLALPLRGPLRVRGTLVIACRDRQGIPRAADRPLFDAVASLAAIAVERLHFVDVARGALLGVESEKLRNSLLSALSHDLRTPLTVLVGLADSLERSRPPLAARQRELAASLREQALAVSRQVEDLLEMARLQAGRVTLRREWQPLEEVVGSSLKAVEALLVGREVVVDLPAGLPLVDFDAVLIERVLANLIENAAKYAPSGALEIAARTTGTDVEVSVADRGPGLPAGSADALFRMFERGPRAGDVAGTGLGLAICRAIVEAHGGSIRAVNREGGGARFAFTLPAKTPPALDGAALDRAAGVEEGAP